MVEAYNFRGDYMDPISHGMVGLAIASITGEPVIGAVSIGSTLGAMSPDLDIIMQFKGHLSYLRNHRGMSHSIPFLAGTSLIISFILRWIFPETSFGQILLWTFLGSLSHSLLDILNSYGAQLFWPISKKRFSGSLLLSYDPAIIIISLYLLLSNEAKGLLAMKAGLFFLIYLFIRYMLRYNIYDRIIKMFGRDIQIKNVKLLPCMTRFHKLHFIVEAKEKFIVGEVNILSRRFEILRELKKREIPHFEEILQSKVGEFFNSFTPMYHIDVQDKGDYYYVTFTDLRFIYKNEFVYHATAKVSKELETLEGIFHPYNLNQRIVIA